MISCSQVIKDKNGLPINEFAIIKIYHFYGKTLRGGIGRNYMYKQVQKKEFKGKRYWSGLHLTKEGGDFFLNPNEDLIMQNTEVVQDLSEFDYS